MRGATVLLLATLVAAGCVAPAAPAADVQANAIAGVDADGFAPVLFDGFLFQELDLEHDGLRIHADVYLPDAPTGDAAPETFPTIVMLSPYWAGGTRGDPTMFGAYDLARQRLLPRGYALVYADLAGNGGAGGCWDFMGPVERASAVATVEAIAAQEWSDGKVGMYGISYDGMTQIMAASDQAPHLVTVVPAAPLTSAYKGLIQNGVHYGGGWRGTVTSYESSSVTGPADPFSVVFGGGPNPERLPGWMDTLQDSPACLADNHQGYTPTNAHTDYFDARDYQALGGSVKASVFYVQGFLDPAVKPDNFGAWFDAVPTTKKAWLGHWYHMYPDAQGGGRDDMFLTLHRWFDHTLKGIDNGIDKEPMVDVMDSAGGWRREDAWPPKDVAPLTYQLDASGALVLADAQAGAVTIGAPTDAATFALGTSPVGLASPLASATTFETGALATPLRIAGSPWVNVTLASDRPAGIVVAKLLDGERLVSQGAFNLLYAGGLAEPEPLSPDQRVTVSFAMYPTDWVTSPGATLTLALMVQDPDVWFEGEASGAILTLDAGETATLTLPTIARAEDAVFLTSCGWPLEGVVDGCFHDLDDLGMEFPE